MNDEIKDKILAIRDKMGITKVVVTRSVKGPSGDIFVGFSAAWDTVQDDGGQGLVDALDDNETPKGMTLNEAKVAAHLLSLQVDTAAFQNAAASSIITQEEANRAIRAVKHNYSSLMVKALESDG